MRTKKNWNLFCREIVTSADREYLLEEMNKYPLRRDEIGCLEVAAFKTKRAPGATLLMASMGRAFFVTEGKAFHWRRLARFCEDVAKYLDGLP